MRTNNYKRQEDRYNRLECLEEKPLLEWLLLNLKESKSKVKAILEE